MPQPHVEHHEACDLELCPMPNFRLESKPVYIRTQHTYIHTYCTYTNEGKQMSIFISSIYFLLDILLLLYGSRIPIRFRPSNWRGEKGFPHHEREGGRWTRSIPYECQGSLYAFPSSNTFVSS